MENVPRLASTSKSTVEMVMFEQVDVENHNLYLKTALSGHAQFMYMYVLASSPNPIKYM